MCIDHVSQPDISHGLQEYQKKTLSPTWNEDKWLLVQEPKTQGMRVQMFDHDILNLKVITSPAVDMLGRPARETCSAVSSQECIAQQCWSPGIHPGLSEAQRDRSRHRRSVCHLLQSHLARVWQSLPPYLASWLMQCES